MLGLLIFSLAALLLTGHGESVTLTCAKGSQR
jgi:hypothetical protein